jgi:hypothetical protein
VSRVTVRTDAFPEAPTVRTMAVSAYRAKLNVSFKYEDA